MVPFTLAFKYMCTLFIYTKLIAVLLNTDLERNKWYLQKYLRIIYVLSTNYLLTPAMTTASHSSLWRKG